MDGPTDGSPPPPLRAPLAPLSYLPALAPSLAQRLAHAAGHRITTGQVAHKAAYGAKYAPTLYSLNRLFNII